MSGSEHEDLTFRGFGGAICCEGSTDLLWWSYDPALSGCPAIPFPDDPPRPVLAMTTGHLEKLVVTGHPLMP